MATVSQQVKDKGERIYHANGVHLAVNDGYAETYAVDGEHGSYTVIVFPGNEDADRCSCLWNRWQPRHEAVCSHIYAARLSRAMTVGV
jgi:hypothetical protein